METRIVYALEGLFNCVFAAPHLLCFIVTTPCAVRLEMYIGHTQLRLERGVMLREEAHKPSVCNADLASYRTRNVVLTNAYAYIRVG
jgi:hypothetical protein